MSEAAPQSSSRPAAASSAAGRGMRVLVVDDEPALRELLKETMQSDGYEVHTAESGEAALQIFKQQKFDIVFSDIRMPGMSGLTLLDALKQINPDVEVVIMTSHASIDTAIGAIRAGAYDYLLKPFEELDLVLTLLRRVSEKIRLVRENANFTSQLRFQNQELEKLNNSLLQMYEEVTMLYNFSKLLTTTLDLEEIINISVDALSELSGGKPSMLLTLASDTGELKVRKVSHMEADGLDQLRVVFKEKDYAELVNKFKNIKEFRPLKEQIEKHFKIQSFFASPLLIQSEPFGVLVVLDKKDEGFSQLYSSLLPQFCNQVAIAYDNARLHNSVKEMAIKDGLTGLYNHRYFHERQISEVSRAGRYNRKLSLIFVDIDHFKEYNDKYGHPTGDKVLKMIAEMLGNSSRKSDVVLRKGEADIVARYGGEEFVIILPETEKAGAMAKAEVLRKATAQRIFPIDIEGAQRITISVGIATFPDDARAAKELINAADKALYLAKEGGRNRVCTI